MNYKDIYAQWLEEKHLDLELKQELLSLKESDVIERFSTPLQFGTGGLRGPMGVGISRLNIHTMMQAAAGFGAYLKDTFSEGLVVISYDNRKDSRRFALKSAQVLIALGFQTKVFESLRPTPMLSYAVRYFKAIGGIMITASHNPKEDSGFKAYNHTGAQVNLKEARAIIDQVSRIENIFDIQEGPESKIEWIDASFDDVYLNDITSIQIKDLKKTIKIVYSPLHGTGGPVIPKLLRQYNYEVFEVEEEMIPDPAFTNTKSSNPEQSDAYNGALKKAKEVDADLILITDPDADRLGVAVKHHDTYHLLTGNQTAAIELDYILETSKNIPKDGIVYTTIVTSDIIKRIAEAKHLNVIETLTGFKFIGEQAELQDAPYIFGCEESYGSLISDKVRDKDAVQACFLLSEITNYYQSLDQSLVDALNRIYKTHGFHLEYTESIFFKGISGPKHMSDIMDALRQHPLDIQGHNRLETRDYQQSKQFVGEQVFDLTLPKSNVLEFRFESFWVILRPSGTEPKLKIYFGVKEKDEASAQRMLSYIKTEVLKRITHE
jgi:phosphoglucomutase